MNLPVFRLEDYLSPREFTTKYNFASSDMESRPMSEIVADADPEARKLWDSLSLCYTQTQGHPALIEEIAKLFPGVATRSIFCLAGAEEGIFCAFHSLLTSRDHAVVVAPCYQSLQSIPASICDVTEVHLKPGKRWSLDLNELFDATRSNTKVIILNFPHNPTGALLHIDELNEIIAFCRKRNLFLFSDEAYRGLEHDPSRLLPTAASLYEKAISLGVMSKTYGLAGLRIGWLVSQDEGLVHKVEQLKHYLSICNSAPSEILAIMGLRNKELAKRNRELLLSNLELTRTFFRKNAETFEWIEPEGGCIAYLKLKLDEPIEHFADRLQTKQGLLILPGTVFSDTENYFRIGYGRKSAPESLIHFESFLQP